MPRKTLADLKLTSPTRVSILEALVEEERERAITRADSGVTETWKMHAARIIKATARVYPEFTSEEVWEMGLRKPSFGSPDGDALGPALRRAAKAEIIQSTGRLTTETLRPQRHNNPKRIWRSLIYDP